MHKFQKVALAALSALVLSFLVSRELIFRYNLSEGLQNLLISSACCSVQVHYCRSQPAQSPQGGTRRLGERSKRIASSLGLKKECKRNKLHIVGPGEGSTTNQIITLAHALGVASSLPRVREGEQCKLHAFAASVLPKTLESFDISLLMELYCIEIAPERTEADYETLRNWPTGARRS